MNAETLTAVAAIAAAVISLINVILTAFLAQHQEGRKWVRELLPSLIGEFTDAVFQYERVVFKTDWNKLSEMKQEALGTEEFKKAMAIEEKLKTFANPATISAAADLLNSIEDIRLASIHAVKDGNFETWHPERRKSYWEYVEADYKFRTIARKEMGLKAPPIPPGLIRRVIQNSSVLTYLGRTLIS